jgi:hypothetical protein
MKNLNEKFFVPKLSELKQVGSIEGIKLYSSKGLRDQYIDSIKNSKYGKYISPVIEKLTLNGSISPCWLNNKITSMPIFNLFSSTENDKISAYYDSLNKTVYVLLDNNVNFLNYVSNDTIAKITIHELMHMIGLRKPNIFHHIFKNELVKFYDNYFEEIFDIRVENLRRQTDEYLITFLIDLSKKYKPTQRDVAYYSNIIQYLYMKDSSYDENQFKRILMSLMDAISVMVSSPVSFIRLTNIYSDILLKPLREAYKKTFGSFPKNTMMYQEVIFISEVISVYSEINITPPIIRAVQSLK